MNKKRHSGWLMVGAIGVVFGDIGTSPLYALQSILTFSGLKITNETIFGLISLIIWSIIIIVTLKYITLLMRVSNHGEGGIMALVSLVRQTAPNKKRAIFFTLLGITGITLFYGDGIITPAISVLSAVEGTKLILPAATPFIIPLAIIFITGLFIIQSKGTSAIGKLFGPIMIVWFFVSATGGLLQIIEHPAVLQSLLPTTALSFIMHNPLHSFIAMGAVILAISGAEALYADMGHFGRKPITKAWLLIVFPALTLTYLGQGALVAEYPSAAVSAYYLMFPESVRLFVIILATIATLIASQAIIAGVFSLTWQAVRLGLLPRLTVRHTSRYEFGQVYIPLLNWTMLLLVIATIVGFGNSKNLAAMFGLAVSGTLIVDTIFLLFVMRVLWRFHYAWIVLAGIVILGLEVVFLAASGTKLMHGAWVPILIALIGFAVISTWYKGHEIIKRERTSEEGTLKDFAERLRRSKAPRVKGHAVYIGHHAGNAPMALHATLDQLHELHRNIIVVTVETTDAAHVPDTTRIVFDELGHPDDGISHVTLRFGYKDIPNVPRALEQARSTSAELDFNPLTSTYFVSATKPTIVHNKRMAKWRKQLYVFMDRNADNHSDYFKLPLDHTIEMKSYLEL